MQAYRDKIVLITGAGGGLGREMARQLAVAGARLILTDIAEANLRETADEIRARSSDAVLGTPVVDISDVSGCRALFEKADALGPVDVLINNAGIALIGPFLELPRDKWELQMGVNALAPMRLCAEFLPGMVARGSGRVINISSLAGVNGVPLLSTYSSGKFSLRGFTEALHLELRESGIFVTGIYPSFTRTAILDSPRYGIDENDSMVPNFIVDDPAKVIRKALRGAARGKVHVYPSLNAKSTAFWRHAWPGMVRFAMKRMKKRLGG